MITAKNQLLRHLILLLLTSIGFRSYGQQDIEIPFHNPPVNIEPMAGNRGISFQMIIDKKIKSMPQIGFFSVTDLNSDWGEKNISDLMTQANLTLDLVKGLRLSAGFHYTPVTGIRPSAGLIYAFANENWLFIASPRIDLQQNPNIEAMVLAEFKPKINDNWRLYSRLQGLYSQMTEIDMHGRSYVRARAGLSYREIAFGVGANIEYYGPLKLNENNIGVFTKIMLF
jgi:hypothetical protein